MGCDGARYYYVLMNEWDVNIKYDEYIVIYGYKKKGGSV